LYTIESYLKVHVLLADTFLSYTSSKINILHIIRWCYSTLLLFFVTPSTCWYLLVVSPLDSIEGTTLVNFKHFKISLSLDCNPGCVIFSRPTQFVLIHSNNLLSLKSFRINKDYMTDKVVVSLRCLFSPTYNYWPRSSPPEGFILILCSKQNIWSLFTLSISNYLQSLYHLNALINSMSTNI
jgi:hypothetical protein